MNEIKEIFMVEVDGVKHYFATIYDRNIFFNQLSMYWQGHCNMDVIDLKERLG